MMVKKRRSRKVVLHSQARTFVTRLRKYFCLENLNKGPLLPVDRVCERVAAALHLSTESVIRITEKDKHFGAKLSHVKNKFRFKTFSTKPPPPPYIAQPSTDIMKEQLDIIPSSPSQTFQKLILNEDLAKNSLEDTILKIEQDDSLDNDNTQDESEIIKTYNIIKCKPKHKKIKKRTNTTQYDKSENFIISDNSMATCKICFKTVVYRTRNSHIKKYHPLSDSRVMVKCDLCDQVFSEHKLKRHILLMHGKTCSKCAYCRSDFASKDNLKDHLSACTKRKRIRVTRPEEIELVQCELCGKEMQRASLKAHKNKIHYGLAPVCEHCGKSFGNRLRLMDHCRAKHGYEKLKCNRCDFESSNQVSLENHMRKHDGIKPYMCDKCGVGFHGAYLLMQHRRSHTDVKTHKCDLCPSIFKSTNNLACHKASCHNVTQFSCSCGKRFSCLNYAKRHAKKQTIGKHEIDKCTSIKAVRFDGI